MANLVPGKVVDLVDSAMSKAGLGLSTDSKESSKGCVTLPSKPDPSGARMQAVHLEGKHSIRVCDTPKPGITDETDAIVRITSTAICGTDLHMYLGNVPGMKSHQVIGHEGMGIVESVGPRVSKFKPGDRVVISCQIACGECYWCKDQKNFSCCDCTNPSTTQDKMMGAHTAGILGFSEMNSGLQGTQAEFIRVPIADVNLLKLPPQQELPDEKVLFLSDILCTSWFGTELANVSPNDVVAIWGCGPVGLLAAECCFARGAKRVIMVDNVKHRLDFAKRILPKVETVDFSKDTTSMAGEKQVLELCKNEIAKAPDCCIECVGMHYAHSFIHRVEMAIGMETDTPEALNAAIFACRKGGRVAAIGAYVGFTNHFNIGTLMEKNITLATGQVPVQRYWNELLNMIRQGKIQPEKIITHRMKLSQAPQAFKMFNEKTDGCVKVVLTPDTAGTMQETVKTS